jgi:hypothetical protein
MSDTMKRSLLTLAALVFGGAAQLPDLATYPLVAQGLVMLAGFFAGWAHMQKPGAPVVP